MNIARRIPTMTREEFFPWAQAQDTRYEFDGFAPVAMTGGNVRHSQITGNLLGALRARLRLPCRVLGPDAGLRTVGDTIRYPDALVSCTTMRDTTYEAPGAVVVFEALSPSSGHVDRIVKVREYREVASIRRYIIIESASVGVSVHERSAPDEGWTITTLTADDRLALPELGIELPVAVLYEGTDLAMTDQAD